MFRLQLASAAVSTRAFNESAGLVIQRMGFATKRKSSYLTNRWAMVWCKLLPRATRFRALALDSKRTSRAPVSIRQDASFGHALGELRVSIG